MEAYRLRALLRTGSPFSLQKFMPFCSASAANPRRSSFFSNDSEGGSLVYRHALKFQRPTTMKWQGQLYNSVSFIGSVHRPLKVINTRNDRFGVHTSLNVRTSLESHRTFRIFLKMWDEMAVISFKHLKPNDFIYVSGHLGSYEKADTRGKLRTYYEVNVKDLNYVAKCSQGLIPQKAEKSESEGGTHLEKYRSRLHLWQLFFANPYEWWDNRKCKSNPRQPDFKHKDMDEALWIDPNDPPWVKRQLELHDSRMAEQGLGKRGTSHSRLSTWVYDG